MLFRLVRPMKRDGSRMPIFVQRIPTDVMSRAVGTRLAIPLGGDFRPPAMRAKTTIVTFRTVLDLADVGTIKPSL